MDSQCSQQSPGSPRSASVSHFFSRAASPAQKDTLHLVNLRQYRLDGRTGIVAVLVLVVFSDWFVHSIVYVKKVSDKSGRKMG